MWARRMTYYFDHPRTGWTLLGSPSDPGDDPPGVFLLSVKPDPLTVGELAEVRARLRGVYVPPEPPELAEVRERLGL